MNRRSFLAGVGALAAAIALPRRTKESPIGMDPFPTRVTVHWTDAEPEDRLLWNDATRGYIRYQGVKVDEAWFSEDLDRAMKLKVRMAR